MSSRSFKKNRGVANDLASASGLSALSLAFLLLLGTGVLRAFESYQLIFNASIVFGFVYILYEVVRSALLIRVRKIVFFPIFLLLTVILLSSISANLSLGQPVLFGLLSLRNFFLVGVALLTYRILMSRKSVKTQVENSYKLLGFSTIAIISLTFLFFDPSEFNESSNFIIRDASGENRFSFPAFFALPLLFLYFSRYNQTRKKSEIYKASLTFAWYLIFAGGLTAMCSIVFTLAVFYIIHSKQKAFIMLPFIAGIVFYCLVFFLLIIEIGEWRLAGEIFDLYRLLFFNHEITENFSIIARLSQFEIARDLVSEHYVWGFGALSNQWEGGYLGLFGYFHPSDLGIIGAVVKYGVLGVVLLLILYFILIRSSMPIGLGNVAGMASLMTVFFLIVSSIATGDIFFRPEKILFFIFIISALKVRGEGKSHRQVIH